jgi:hypothetical protein
MDFASQDHTEEDVELELQGGLSRCEKTSQRGLGLVRSWPWVHLMQLFVEISGLVPRWERRTLQMPMFHPPQEREKMIL